MNADRFSIALLELALEYRRQREHCRTELAKAQAVMAEMRALGDRFQSEASRLAEFVQEHGPDGGIPYGVRMAALQIRSDVEAWTTLRRSEAR